MDETDYIENQDPVTRGHETSDANFRVLVMTGIGLLGVMIVGMLISWAVYAIFEELTANPGAPTETFTTPERVPPPAPNLEANPRDTLLVLRRIEDSLLTTYGWSKKDSGLVRVPIEKAMKMIVEQGLPYQQAKGR